MLCEPEEAAELIRTADLRSFNGQPGSSVFGAFFEEASALTSEVASAAHERRHGQPGVSYTNSWLSAKDFLDQVREKFCWQWVVPWVHAS